MAAVLPLLYAHAQHRYTSLPASSVWVEGTSNKTKNWKARVSTFDVVVTGDLSAAPPRIDSAFVTIDANSLKGEVDRGAFVMNRLIKQSLNTEAFQEVRFVLTSFESAQGTEMSAAGTLTLSGVTNDIKIPCMLEKSDDGQIVLTGHYSLSMPEYRIDPPSIRTLGYHVGKDVDVFFELYLDEDVSPQ